MNEHLARIVRDLANKESDYLLFRIVLSARGKLRPGVAAEKITSTRNEPQPASWIIREAPLPPGRTRLSSEPITP